ncbi:PIN domain-containing protein [Cupriavidus sp. BIS7]|uniref:PIN domain-containing protein n=1 Tax=Cupriavidus sp. BIS7 TaxID=1217718 RepID=UPI001ED90517|nr:PIN domain-containing protein [Cupriavidus sp. BIS7]
MVDFENVQAVDLDRLGDAARLTVFAGESQKKVPIGLAMGLHALGEKARWVRASGGGPNALDFHIAFELGRMVEAGERGPVIVLSRDKGFDPLLAWLGAEAGVEARRAATLEEAFGEKPSIHRQAQSPAEPKLVSASKSPMQPPAIGLHANAAAAKPASAPAAAVTRPVNAAGAKVASGGSPKIATHKAAAVSKEKGGVKNPSAERVREILGRSRKATRPRRRLTLAKHIKAMFKAHELAESEVETIIAKLLANRSISESDGVISYNF